MPARVEDGGGGARVVRPEAPRAGVVLIGEVGVPDADTLAAAGRLAEEGYLVAVPDLGGDDATRADPEALRQIAAARAIVIGAGRTFVVGAGVGGTLARLAACAMLGFAGAVGFYGRIVYPTITARRPMQPLDLLPGLGCPLQCHFGDADPAAPPAHVEQLEARLRDRTVPSQVFRYPGVGAGFVTPSHPGYRPGPAALAWARARTFLDMLTEA